jgi:LmbE family N-acetylglucosaminyl deacetylase
VIKVSIPAPENRRRSQNITVWFDRSQYHPDHREAAKQSKRGYPNVKTDAREDLF